jgi:serine/threonine-protein phosphatase 2A regulatory subunit A
VPDVYRVVSEADKAIVLQLYTKLIEDESPLVQRAAANSFLKLAAFADANVLKGDLSVTIKQLIENENTTVKVIAIESLASFLTTLRNATGSIAELKTNFSPMLRDLFIDPSWRIRQAVAKNAGQLVECYRGDSEEVMITLRGVVALMVDPEPDVRILTINSITAAVTDVGAEAFLNEYIPVAEKITDDPMSSVRKALADKSVELVGKVGAANVAQSLSGLIVKLMADDDPLVRLRILKKVNIIAEEAPGLCTRLTEPLKSMFSDSNWRVRKQLAVSTPALVQHMGCDYFSTHTLPVFVALLKDGVDEVRIACAMSLSAIAKLVDINWAFDNLFPALKEMATDEYLIRLTMLTALEGLLSMELPDKFYSEALALALAATRDRVPNVRLRAAQILGVVAIANENCRGSIRPALSDLQSHDKDKDVKFFASESLRLIPAN